MCSLRSLAFQGRHDHANKVMRFVCGLQAFMTKLQDTVYLAERALLYTLSFQLQVAHPYQWMLATIREHKLDSLRPQENSKLLPQIAWNLVNHSWRTTLCLQHCSEDIAAAAIYLALKSLKARSF